MFYKRYLTSQGVIDSDEGEPSTSQKRDFERPLSAPEGRCIEDEDGVRRGYYTTDSGYMVTITPFPPHREMVFTAKRFWRDGYEFKNDVKDASRTC